MSEDIRKYWRLVERTYYGAPRLMIDEWNHGMERWEEHDTICNGKTQADWVCWPNELVLINALLHDKRRNPNGELDYAALSPKTCSVLRELGVKIPEEEQNGDVPSML